MGDDAHVGRARALLLPCASRRSDSHLVHSLVAGLDGARARDIRGSVGDCRARVLFFDEDLGLTPMCSVYVLVTPARNEAKYIEGAIKSVVAQTARPLKWVIVSDGSTDGTDDIVRRYATVHRWIELIR